MSNDHPWRLRVYRWTTLEGAPRDRPLECVLDVPLDETDGISKMDLEDTHGSIERADRPPAKTIGEIISDVRDGKPGSTVIGHRFVLNPNGPGCKECGWPKENHL